MVRGLIYEKAKVMDFLEKIAVIIEEEAHLFEDPELGYEVRAEYAAELASKGIAVPPEEDTEQMQLDKPKKNPTPGRWRDMRYVNEPGYVMNLEYGQHFGYVTWENYLK
ncbi:hypothetical protein DTO282F9_7780 [Paecilomyces variotii]|nr:hypothetical protein DTO282F9_7780 [Paecilomyces variotii]